MCFKPIAYYKEGVAFLFLVSYAVLYFYIEFLIPVLYPDFIYCYINLILS